MDDTLPAPKTNVTLPVSFPNLWLNPRYSLICSKDIVLLNLISAFNKGNVNFSINLFGNTLYELVISLNLLISSSVLFSRKLI